MLGPLQSYSTDWSKGDERILTSALRIPWQIVHELSLLYNPDNVAELHSALCCLEETLIPAYMHLVCSNYYKYMPMLLNFLCHLHLCSSIIHSEIVSVSTYILELSLYPPPEKFAISFLV